MFQVPGVYSLLNRRRQRLEVIDEENVDDNNASTDEGGEDDPDGEENSDNDSEKSEKGNESDERTGRRIKRQKTSQRKFVGSVPDDPLFVTADAKISDDFDHLHQTPDFMKLNKRSRYLSTDGKYSFKYHSSSTSVMYIKVEKLGLGMESSFDFEEGQLFNLGYNAQVLLLKFERLGPYKAMLHCEPHSAIMAAEQDVYEFGSED